MSIVLVTADPNLSVALSSRQDLGAVEVITEDEFEPTTDDPVAVIIDLTGRSSPDLVRRWRDNRPELPIIVLGGADTIDGLPDIHHLTRPLSLEGLASLLRDLAPDEPEAEGDGRDEPWLRRVLAALGYGRRDATPHDDPDGGTAPTRATGVALPDDAPNGAARTERIEQASADERPHAASEVPRPPDGQEEALTALRKLVAEAEAEQQLWDPTGEGPGSNRDLSALAGATIDRVSTELGADTVIVWGRDDHCWYVVDAFGLSEPERCVTMPLDHPLPRALESRPSIRSPARDLIHAIPGLTRLMSRPAHAVAIRRDGDLAAVVMVADPSLFDADLHLVESIVADLRR